MFHPRPRARWPCFGLYGGRREAFCARMLLVQRAKAELLRMRLKATG